MSPLRWRVAALAVAVVASAAAVPALVGSSSRTTPEPTAVGPSAPAPTTTSAPTTTPAAVSTSARPTTPPVPTTTRPSVAPSLIRFRPITIDATATSNRRDGVEVTQCLTCLSGSRVQYLGQGHTLVVPIRKVPVAGRRTLTIVYTCGCDDAPRRLDLRVNDDDPHSLPLKGAGSWEDPAKTKLSIRLRKGTNQIIFYNVNDPAPDLDRIEIT